MVLGFLRLLVSVLLPKCLLGPLSPWAYGLNCVPHPNSSVEALTPNVTAFKDRACKKVVMAQ